MDLGDVVAGSIYTQRKDKEHLTLPLTLPLTLLYDLSHVKECKFAGERFFY